METEQAPIPGAIITEEPEQDVTVEEYWPSIQSHSLQVQREIHEIKLTKDQNIHLWMLTEKDLTPLDMTYDGSTEGDDDGRNDILSPKSTAKGGGNHQLQHGDDIDTYYDGTGGMLWLAANCWCLMVGLQVPSLMRYLQSTNRSTKDMDCGFKNSSRSQFHRVCELGCGTGAAGIALLKFLGQSHLSRDHEDRQGSSANPIPDAENRPYYVVFTDSDQESLDWCEKNCKINDIDPSRYSQKVLLWGEHNIPALQHDFHHNDEVNIRAENETNCRPDDLQRNSFDTIIATDVIYDLSMIIPLLQTAEALLVEKMKNVEDKGENNDDDSQQGNYVLLTHVPRFCLPRKVVDDDDDGELEETTTRTNAASNTNYLDLEQHIVTQAAKVGLKLKDMIRVDVALQRYWSCSGVTSMEMSAVSTEVELSLEKLRDSHAVVLVFERT